jgi:hypothetical protein
MVAFYDSPISYRLLSKVAGCHVSHLLLFAMTLDGDDGPFLEVIPNPSWSNGSLALPILYIYKLKF